MCRKKHSVIIWGVSGEEKRGRGTGEGGRVRVENKTVKLLAPARNDIDIYQLVYSDADVMLDRNLYSITIISASQQLLANVTEMTVSWLGDIK